MKYAGFLRWILLIGLILVGVFFTAEYHILNKIWNEDFTKISVVIGAIWLYATYSSGVSAVKLINYDNDDVKWGWQYHERIHDNNEHLASYCSGLGMFGTVIGMIAMMSSIGSMDLANIDMTEFALSMSTALYTTGVGLFANLLIRIQNHSNWWCLENVDYVWEMDRRRYVKSKELVQHTRNHKNASDDLD